VIPSLSRLQPRFPLCLVVVSCFFSASCLFQVPSVSDFPRTLLASNWQTVVILLDHYLPGIGCEPFILSSSANYDCDEDCGDATSDLCYCIRIELLLTRLVLAPGKLGPQEGDQRFQIVKPLPTACVQDFFHRKTPVRRLWQGSFPLLPTTYQVSAVWSSLAVDWSHPPYWLISWRLCLSQNAYYAIFVWPVLFITPTLDHLTVGPTEDKV
jgi:hypothetical protein